MKNIFGLFLGLSSVIVSQFCIILYFYIYKISGYAEKNRIQNKITHYSFSKEALNHLTQLEGICLLGGYLSITWIYEIMPASYYNDKEGINWIHVILQCLLVDSLQTILHFLEHKGFYITKHIYIKSHKPHHRFFNPILFNAFDGSITDTLIMIIVPLFITAQLIHCNLWSYIIFGNIYSSMLTLIHSEYEHPFDFLFRMFGIGTARDHNIHHRLQKYNYGHMFMYWDYIFGTFK